jgi:hypothetical protein
MKSTPKSFNPLVAVSRSGQLAVATSLGIHFSTVPALWKYPQGFGLPKLIQWWQNQCVLLTSLGTCHLFESLASNPVPVLTSRAVKHISASSAQRLIVVTDDCQVYVFSRNPSSGGLKGERLDFLSGRSIRRIGASQRIGVALSKDGSIYSWFWHDPEGSLRHVRCAAPFKTLSVSEDTNYALLRTVSGEVYSCGFGKFGVLGHGGTANEQQPRKLLALNGLEIGEVAASNTFAMCMTIDGRCFRWGTFNDGKVSLLPQELSTRGALSIAGAGSYGAVLTFSLTVELFAEHSVSPQMLHECREFCSRLQAEEASSSQSGFFDSLIETHFSQGAGFESSHRTQAPSQHRGRADSAGRPFSAGPQLLGHRSAGINSPQSIPVMESGGYSHASQVHRPGRAQQPNSSTPVSAIQGRRPQREDVGNHRPNFERDAESESWQPRKRRDLSFFSVEVEKNMETMDRELTALREALNASGKDDHKARLQSYSPVGHRGRSSGYDMNGTRRSDFVEQNNLLLEIASQDGSAGLDTFQPAPQRVVSPPPEADEYDALTAEIEYLNDTVQEREGELAVWKIATRRLMEILRNDRVEREQLQAQYDELKTLASSRDEAMQRQMQRTAAWMEEVQNLERTSKALIESKNAQIRALQSQLNLLLKQSSQASNNAASGALASDSAY